MYGSKNDIIMSLSIGCFGNGQALKSLHGKRKEVCRMSKGHGTPKSDPNGAGWPSTTGRPSGGGRGNNR